MIAVIIIIMLIVIIAALWITLNVVAKKCPTSKLGKKFNDWKAKRALNQEQKKLMALEKFKNSSHTNHTNASDDPLTAIQDNIIHQSGLKVPNSDNMRNAGNRIYPATDVEDGIASQQPSVHPGGMSADEYSNEGADSGKHSQTRS